MNSPAFPPSALIRLRGVSKSYQLDATRVEALSDLTLDIGQGRLTVLAGASGSGKSTLLNIAGCLDKPDSGELYIGDVRADSLCANTLSDLRAARIGFIFQHFNLLPVLSAFENVELPLLMLGVPAAERRVRVEALLTQVGLERFGAHTPGQLSGGQRQRVAIARALVKGPDIVLADEPTANLDSSNGRAVMELLRSLQRELNATVVICSHDPQIIENADDIVILRDGRLLEQRAAVPIDHPGLQ